jgi:hypothetical protein
MKIEVKKDRERLLKFDKSSQDIFKSIERYQLALRGNIFSHVCQPSKGLWDAEAVLNDELLRFYKDEDTENISGSSYDIAANYVRQSREELRKSNTLVINHPNNIYNM